MPRRSPRSPSATTPTRPTASLRLHAGAALGLSGQAQRPPRPAPSPLVLPYSRWYTRRGSVPRTSGWRAGGSSGKRRSCSGSRRDPPEEEERTACANAREQCQFPSLCPSAHSYIVMLTLQMHARAAARPCAAIRSMSRKSLVCRAVDVADMSTVKPKKGTYILDRLAHIAQSRPPRVAVTVSPCRTTHAQHEGAPRSSLPPSTAHLLVDDSSPPPHTLQKRRRRRTTRSTRMGTRCPPSRWRRS